MSLNSLRDEAVNNLQVTSSIINKQGNRIDIGEEFTVRFTIKNNFRGGNGEQRGHAHFNDVKLDVKGTGFADIVGGNQVFDITDHLGYGHTAHKDVTFEAKAKLPLIQGGGVIEVDIPETYAKVKVIGDFDILRFFKIVQEESFAEQIDDG